MTESTSGRQMFRFRLPWMINPAPIPLRALTEPQIGAPRVPVRGTTTTSTVPIQRPLENSVAPPTPLPPQPQAKTHPTKTEHQPSSPSRTMPPPPQLPVPPQTQSTSPPRPQAAPPSSQPPTLSRPTSPPPRSPVPPQSPSVSPPRSKETPLSQPPTPSPTTPQSRVPPSQSQSPFPATTAQSRVPPSQSHSPSPATAPQSRVPPSPATTPPPPQPKQPQPFSSKTELKPPTASQTTSPPQKPKTPTRKESYSKSTPSPSPSRVVSQPQSPSRTPSTKSPPATQTILQPSSSSPTPTQRRIASSSPSSFLVASKTPSPARLASQPPAKTASKESTLQTTSSQTTSSPTETKTLQLRTKVLDSSHPPSPSKPSSSLPESSSKTAKDEPRLSPPLTTESQNPVEIATTPASQSQIQSQKQATLEQDKTQLPRVSTPPAVVAPVPPLKPVTQPSKSSPVPIDPLKRPNSETETKEKNKKTESAIKTNKTMTEVVKEPKPKSSTEISIGSNKQNHGWSSTTSQAKQNQFKHMHRDEKDAPQESEISTAIPEKGMNAISKPHPRPSVSQGERASLQKEIKDDISRFVHKLSSDHPMQPTEPVSVITLTGENKGASMHVGAELARKEGSVHIHRGYKLNQDDNTDSTTDGENSSNGRNLSNLKENTESLAYINSNVQSVNNSIMFNSSISERNPGVKLVSERIQSEPIKTNEKEKSVEAHKANFNVTHSKKLTYEPTIRRRCLRGLLLEPDSDPDNPEKPRSHGCRYDCKESKKCNDNKNEGSETKSKEATA